MSCDAIINHMVFFPERTDAAAVEILPAGVEEVYIKTDDKENLQCFLVTNKLSDKLLIYFHGNAGNIYERLPELIDLAKTGVNVLGVGYRGYGKSTGKPSEKGIYNDGLTALSFAQDKLNISMNKIFICGRSIGTAVAINTSRKKQVAGVILITPLTSGRDVAGVHGFGPLAIIAGDALNNLRKCARIESPVLIIHGNKDEVIPWTMGEKVFAALRGSKKMVTIEGGQHNDLEFINPDLYWQTIEEFVGLNSVG